MRYLPAPGKCYHPHVYQHSGRLPGGGADFCHPRRGRTDGEVHQRQRPPADHRHPNLLLPGIPADHSAGRPVLRHHRSPYQIGGQIR